MLMALTRVCTKCGVDKPLTAFATRQTHRPGKPVSQCMDCKVAYNREYRQANKSRVYEIERKSKLKKAYGVSVEDYDRMLKEQGGGCAICSATVPGERTKYFTVDHCHATGKVRGLLCVKCNRGLGLFNDHVQRLQNAAEYLKRSM